MKLPDTRIILFNVAAGVISLAALVAAARSLVFKPSATPCSERTTASTSFTLERGGVLLTSADLQARLAGRDVGLGENVEIARVKGGPSPIAMGVTLVKGSASPFATLAAKGGVSFPWEPRLVQGKTAGCLAYAVLLPADFDFHRGGILPGLRGAQAADAAGERSQDNFAAQLGWRRNGRGGVTSRTTIDGEARWGSAEQEPFVFPAGRWVRLEQEVVLNTPRKADGVLRVWVDGRLAVERTNMVYRSRPDVTLAGVSADVHYGGEDAVGAAPKDATLWFSPFEVRWQ